MCLYRVMMTLHFLNDVANDAESTQKIDHYVIFATSFKNQLGKLITDLLISSLPGSASIMYVYSLSKPRDVIKRSRSLAW